MAENAQQELNRELPLRFANDFFRILDFFTNPEAINKVKAATKELSDAINKNEALLKKAEEESAVTKSARASAEASQRQSLKLHNEASAKQEDIRKREEKLKADATHLKDLSAMIEQKQIDQTAHFEREYIALDKASEQLEQARIALNARESAIAAREEAQKVREHKMRELVIPSM